MGLGWLPTKRRKNHVSCADNTHSRLLTCLWTGQPALWTDPVISAEAAKVSTLLIALPVINEMALSFNS